MLHTEWKYSTATREVLEPTNTARPLWLRVLQHPPVRLGLLGLAIYWAFARLIEKRPVRELSSSVDARR
jgi:hypothetical protein